MLIPYYAGPCDLGITYGLHVKNNYDIGKMIASPELAHVYDGVLKVTLCDVSNLVLQLDVLLIQLKGGTFTLFPP